MGELGKFLGWLLVISIGATILNFVLKYINKNYRTKILELNNGESVMKKLMLVFVKNHRFWGIATILFLLLHFYVQFTEIGLSKTGLIAGIVLIGQGLLGIYAIALKKPRSGSWFNLHRFIAALLVLTVLAHLVFKR